MLQKLDCLQLINFIEKSLFFRTGQIQHKKILIAFSGGQDSSCLLAIFYILKKKWKFELGVVYCNHCWNDSVKPAFEVFQILQKYNLPFYFVEAPNSTAIKPEQKARDWRYSAFYNILKQESYDFVLTGHSLSDCSETVLFNLVRGSGIKGICSLKEYQIFQMPLAQKTEKSLSWLKKFSTFNLKSNFFSAYKKVNVSKFFPGPAILKTLIFSSYKFFLQSKKRCLAFRCGKVFSQKFFPILNFMQKLNVTDVIKNQKTLPAHQFRRICFCTRHKSFCAAKKVFKNFVDEVVDKIVAILKLCHQSFLQSKKIFVFCTTFFLLGKKKPSWHTTNIFLHSKKKLLCRAAAKQSSSGAALPFRQSFAKAFLSTTLSRKRWQSNRNDFSSSCGKTKKNLNLSNKKEFLKINQKLKKKQDFNFRKTTFFIDSLYNFEIIEKLNLNEKKKKKIKNKFWNPIFQKFAFKLNFCKKKIQQNQFKSFCKSNFLKFKFDLKNQTGAAIQKTQIVKKIKVVETVFCAYLQRLKKFQKLDQSSSLITCFKPSKFKNDQNFFFNYLLEKIIAKKEKEIPTFFFQSKNFTENPKFNFQNEILFQGFLKTNKSLLLKNFVFKKPCQQNKAYEKIVFLNNLQENEFLVFRPLIKINRESLFLFSKILKLPICYDSSNKNLNLTRNSIRKLIIPLLKKINPSAEENIYKFSRILEFYYDVFGNLECPPDRLDIFTP